MGVCQTTPRTEPPGDNDPSAHAREDPSRGGSSPRVIIRRRSSASSSYVLASSPSRRLPLRANPNDHFRRWGKIMLPLDRPAPWVRLCEARPFVSGGPTSFTSRVGALRVV